MLKKPVEVKRKKRKYIVYINNYRNECNSLEEVFLCFYNKFEYIPPYISKFVYQANYGESFNTNIFSIHCVKNFSDI